MLNILHKIKSGADCINLRRRTAKRNNLQRCLRHLINHLDLSLNRLRAVSLFLDNPWGGTQLENEKACERDSTSVPQVMIIVTLARL